MEGNGEGMVAIVQGLDSAGVTLTVVNQPRHHPDRRRSPRSRIPFNPGNAAIPATDQRSSVETTTERPYNLGNKITTGAQICDGRYASSYKTAHCMVTPTSPPDIVSEFPPQRREPCRSQGNFEVGGHGSMYYRASPATSRNRHYAGSQTWADRGVHRNRTSKGTEAFVDSLRKYPSLSPVGSVSSDIIGRIIKFTHSKNYPKHSRSTRSMRSLHKQKSSDTGDLYQVSKHQQTYTRNQDMEHTDRATSSNIQLGYRGRARNFKLYSPVSDCRYLRDTQFKEIPFSSNYDYLRAGSSYARSERDVSRSPSPTRMEERPSRADRPTRSARPMRIDGPSRSFRDMSLVDVSRYIRSTIREIYSERPLVFQVCPKLKNRYNQHKKVCPAQSDRISDSMMQDSEDQGKYFFDYLHT